MPTRDRTRKRRSSPRPNRPDYPYLMKLPDGRRVFVEVPAQWVTTDRDGEVAFLPPAVEFLDRLQVLAMSVFDRPPSPGYLRTLRKALRLTQEQLGQQLGVDKMTVSRWERGTVRPGRRSLMALERLRKHATRKGVTVAG